MHLGNLTRREHWMWELRDNGRLPGQQVAECKPHRPRESQGGWSPENGRK